MRGSPLIRVTLVLLAIAACGIGLAMLTTTPPATAPNGALPPATPASDHIEVPFDLVLSHPARSIRLDPGIEAKALDLPAGPGPHHGLLALDPAHPVIFIDIEWADPTTQGSHRFTKLTLEPPSQPTLTHTFDSTGPLSDVWEFSP